MARQGVGVPTRRSRARHQSGESARAADTTSPPIAHEAIGCRPHPTFASDRKATSPLTMRGDSPSADIELPREVGDSRSAGHVFMRLGEALRHQGDLGASAEAFDLAAY